MDEIKSQESTLTKEKEALETELQKAKAQELNEDRLNDFCRNLPNVLDSLDYNQRRQILKEVVDKIEFPAKRRKTFKLAGKIRRRTKLAGRIKPKIAKMSFYGPF